jgi:hypothetical protein
MAATASERLWAISGDGDRLDSALVLIIVAFGTVFCCARRKIDGASGSLSLTPNRTISEKSLHYVRGFYAKAGNCLSINGNCNKFGKQV